jgi:hypothetical protein
MLQIFINLGARPGDFYILDPSDNLGIKNIQHEDPDKTNQMLQYFNGFFEFV